ncbi:kinase-like protein [Gymnopus androsaceus JB14]|uniref:non-specific serine/threonine protein kinase n=1 Tax=Gymnopus androsaceus JB14 TaxID=1447944 RepID=A0A6A4HBH4_9AGAR|nr:kinase-like protein [Gymnopus androsaceus JB14]
MFKLSGSDQLLHWPGIPYETEEIDRYTLGGFHPVHLGDVFSSEKAAYRVLHKLGWGSFATVWLARTVQEVEISQHPSHYAALKICVANADSNHEVNVHRRLASESLHVANLLDSFSLPGPNGTHTVLVYSVLASLATRGISSFKLTVDERRSLCYQLVQGVAFLHRNGVIHGDLHIQNIGVSLPMLEEHSELDLLEDFQPDLHVVLHCKLHPSPKSLPKYLLPPIDIADYFKPRGLASPQMAGVSAQIMDLGNAAIIGQPLRPCITPPNVCAPEVMFKVVTSESSIASPTFASDIWSLACVLFHIAAGAQVFARASPDIAHLQALAKLCGEMPSEWQKYLPGLESELSPATTDAEWRRRLGKNFRTDKYFEQLGDLMKWMLKMDPAARPSAEEVLQHPWFDQSGRHVERTEATEA